APLFDGPLVFAATVGSLAAPCAGLEAALDRVELIEVGGPAAAGAAQATRLLHRHMAAHVALLVLDGAGIRATHVALQFGEHKGANDRLLHGDRPVEEL